MSNRRSRCLLIPLLCASAWSGVAAFDQDGRLRLPASAQREGDAARGRDYLVNGDYLDSGIPLGVYRIVRGSSKRNDLGRAGENATLPPGVTAVTAANGETVVTANCLACHGQVLRGQFVLGLGNSLRDFTEDASTTANLIDQMLVFGGAGQAAQREAFATFRDVIRTVAPHIRTPTAGTNPAIKLAYVLSAHRDPVTLEWSDRPLLPLPPAQEVIPSDVPAWWLLRKKNAMFHTGMGRGDFARTMMASSLMTLQNAGEAEVIDDHFKDVLAFLKTLTPPPFPGKVDPQLSARGARVFARRCASCHGTYGEEETYPNLLIHLDAIGTDPALARAAAAAFDGQVRAYNESWFGQGPHAARLVPEPGYVAPPLDGVWATAPYLHNASVPDLETLLDSRRRPRFWRRSFESRDYDLTKVGWRYTPETAGGHKHIYDTTLPGHAATGHTYGDDLTVDERRAVIEYLKTL